MPPVQITNPNAQNWPDNGTNALEFGVSPLITAWYPNYNAAPSILVCPSDPQDSVDDLKDSDGDWNFWKEGRAKDADLSYVYVGWILDLLQHPQIPPVTLDHFPALNASAGMFGFSIPDGDPLVSHQFGTFLDALLGKALNLVTSPSGSMGIELMKLATSDFKVPQGIGNGRVDRLYRMKEGNERFMITDVNNPQTAAMAQSTLCAMMDAFGNYNKAIAFFNHVPGGCNVLFMDGHVDWIPYVPPAPGQVNTPSMDLGATQPILPSIANIMGLF